MGWCFATPLQCLLAGSIHGSIHGFDRATDARPVVGDYLEVEDLGFAGGGGGTPLADSGRFGGRTHRVIRKEKEPPS